MHGAIKKFAEHSHSRMVMKGSNCRGIEHAHLQNHFNICEVIGNSNDNSSIKKKMAIGDAKIQPQITTKILK